MSRVALHGAIIVVSDQTFLFIIGHDGREPSPTWHALLHSAGTSEDVTLWVSNDDSLRMRVGQSLYIMYSVSDTLLRWRLDPTSTWTFRRGNLPRARGSCWRMEVSHPRYGRIYQTYMGAMKRRFTGLSQTMRYLTHATMLEHVKQVAVPTAVAVPRDRVRMQQWLGRAVS